MPRENTALAVLAILLLSGPAAMVTATDDSAPTTCTVLVDWDVEEHWDGGWNLTYDVLHRYLVVFDPQFTNGSSPSALTVDVQHIREGEVIATISNATVVSAGGEVDIFIDSEPEFKDRVSISVETGEASCRW